MNTDQRFAISIHALTLLAANKDPLTSEMIADSVDTNPVVIRRTMAGLREYGIVDSKSGVNGGWRLLRAPETIQLRDVYRGLGDNDVLGVHEHPNKHCPIGKKIKGPLLDIFASAQGAMVDSLSHYTIADVLKDVRSRAG
jgi:Rrf2 family protein